LNVGVDIGSRGVGDASGVGVGEGLAVAVGDGDGVAGGLGGSCATTRSGNRTRSEITVNTHEDMVINSFLLVVIEMELVKACEAGIAVDPNGGQRILPIQDASPPSGRKHKAWGASPSGKITNINLEPATRATARDAKGLSPVITGSICSTII